MIFPNVQRILGLLLSLFSLTMLPPIVVALIFRDQHGARSPHRRYRACGRSRDVAAAEAARGACARATISSSLPFWIVLGGFERDSASSLRESPVLDWPDAVFESISGLTTTAYATVLVNVDDLPPSILFYRPTATVVRGPRDRRARGARSPMLGVGGMQLYRRSSLDRRKDTKLTPRITETAKALWYVYFGMIGGVRCLLGWPACPCSMRSAIASAPCRSAAIPRTTRAWRTSTAPRRIGGDRLHVRMGAANFSLHFVAWRERSTRATSPTRNFMAYCWISCGVGHDRHRLSRAVRVLRCERAAAKAACSMPCRSRRRRGS